MKKKAITPKEEARYQKRKTAMEAIPASIGGAVYGGSKINIFTSPNR